MVVVSNVFSKQVGPYSLTGGCRARKVVITVLSKQVDPHIHLQVDAVLVAIRELLTALSAA